MSAPEFSVTVVGAAAIFDYILPVEQLPRPGSVARILEDAAPGRAFCGGCAPNIAAGLAQLGAHVCLVYPVGVDFNGSSCQGRWEALGIDLSNVSRVPGQRSGFAYIFFQADGETACFAYPGAAEAAQAPSGVTLAPTVVVGPVLGSFTRPVLERAIEEHRQVILTGIAAVQVIDYLPHLAAIVINAAEATLLGKQLGLDDYKQLARRFPDCRFYITEGEAGSRVYYEGQESVVPSIAPSRFRDPTGAGDGYTAGVVLGLRYGLDPTLAGYLGAAIASFVVEEFGGQTSLPDWPSLLRRLSEQQPPVADRLLRAMNG